MKKVLALLGLLFLTASSYGFPCGETYEGIHVYCAPENDYFFCSAPSAEWRWHRTERTENFGGVDYTVANYQCGDYYPPDVTTIIEFEKYLGIVTIEHGESFDVWCPGYALMVNYSEMYEGKVIPISRLDCRDR